jgi:hypothetical protein
MTNSDDYMCMVCYESFDEKIVRVTTNCGHKYCRRCFILHMKVDDKCAMCRTCIDPKHPSFEPKHDVYQFQFRPVSEYLYPGIFQSGRNLPPMTIETLRSIASMTTSEL